VHTASPVGINPRNHEDMIRPAVNGVTFVVEAAAKFNIQRVVITSSVAAVSCLNPMDDDHEYDESMWTDLPTADFSAYIKSKTLAEKAAWNLQE
jgi:dihydroflavonol-4-reductase